MSGHPWASDPQAQAAVRAAEDAAAAERTPLPEHRDLPQAVAELRERVAVLEDHCRAEATKLARLWKSHEGVMAYEDAVPPAPASRPAETRQTQAKRVGSGWWFDKSSAPPPPPPPAPPPVFWSNVREGAPPQPAPVQITEGDTLSRAGKNEPSNAQNDPKCTERDNGLRTERVYPEWQQAKWGEALAIIHEGGSFGRGNCFSPGTIAALMIWADKEIARLTAERDAALGERDAAKEECERLRHLLKTKESECETHHPWVHPSAAPAANAGGGSNQPSAGGVACGDHGKAEAQVAPSRSGPAVTDGRPAATAEPVAWALAWAVWGRGTICGVTVSREDAEYMQREFAFDTELLPLYNAPQRQRSWLTAAERACIEELLPYTFSSVQAKTLTMLLARSTPPLVKVRGPWTINGVPGDGSQAWKPMIDTILSRRDDEWIAAIREAGGEVAE